MENPFEIISERLNRIEEMLEIIIEHQKSEQHFVKTKEFLKINEVAEYISLHKSTIYGYTMQRKIPFIKTGKRLLFKKAEIDEWLTKNRKKTKDEIYEDAMIHIRPRKKKIE